MESSLVIMQKNMYTYGDITCMTYGIGGHVKETLGSKNLFGSKNKLCEFVYIYIYTHQNKFLVLWSPGPPGPLSPLVPYDSLVYSLSLSVISHHQSKTNSQLLINHCWLLSLIIAN